MTGVFALGLRCIPATIASCGRRHSRRAAAGRRVRPPAATCRRGGPAARPSHRRPRPPRGTGEARTCRTRAGLAPPRAAIRRGHAPGSSKRIKPSSERVDGDDERPLARPRPSKSARLRARHDATRRTPTSDPARSTRDVALDRRVEQAGRRLLGRPVHEDVTARPRSVALRRAGGIASDRSSAVTSCPRSAASNDVAPVPHDVRRASGRRRKEAPRRRGSPQPGPGQ